MGENELMLDVVDKEFYNKVDEMFESKLKYEEIQVIRVKDIKENKVLHHLDYDKLIRFDANLNMYKLLPNGNWVKVENENFKPIVTTIDKH